MPEIKATAATITDELNRIGQEYDVYRSADEADERAIRSNLYRIAAELNLWRFGPDETDLEFSKRVLRHVEGRLVEFRLFEVGLTSALDVLRLRQTP